MDRRTGRTGTLALALLGGLAVWWISTQVFPYHSLNHDEAVYLQQAAMLLEGQLNLWPPVDDVFRPWFFVEDGDRLYPKYSPVPAAIFALGRVFGDYRLALVAVTVGNLSLVSAVVREVFDRSTGLIAAAFVLASPLFLLDSSVFLSYAPTTLFNLAFAYSYFRADRSTDRRWPLAAGAAIGIAFFARPYTAVLFASPFIAHAGWRMWTGDLDVIVQNGLIAGVGLVGVGLTLGYNAAMTGSPWLFPYQAFAPLDGLGFGRREILAHDVDYTLELALRSNQRVATQFFTEWIAGGLVGLGVAIYGVGHTISRGLSAREAVLGGLFASVLLGNLYFWGNFNILGDITRPGDGLIAVLGPYYHFDLLLPTATFAAVGIAAIVEHLGQVVSHRTRVSSPRLVATIAVVLLIVGSGGVVTAQHLDDRVGENMDATAVYEVAYEPFDGGPPSNALVFLPTPYGDWLNHPFQTLRNEPGFDGQTVYAMDERPFDLIETYPDRRLFRYTYRGTWAPFQGSPRAARLKRLQVIRGQAIHLDSTIGIPDGAIGVTARLAVDDQAVYHTASAVNESLDLRVTMGDGLARLTGDFGSHDGDVIEIAGRETIHLTVFVDYGLGGGFSYRYELPIESADGSLRALSPRVRYCRAAMACGPEAAFIPEALPDGISVQTELVSEQHKS